MFLKLRWSLLKLLGAKNGTAIMVGSYITTGGEHGISVALSDGWTEAKARLSPAGARRIAESLNTWAAAAEQNNSVGQWKAVIRYAVKDGIGHVGTEAGPVAAAT